MPFNSFEDYPMTWTPALQPSREPTYKALARQLEADITSGVLRPGTKLPPQRELADYLDINVSTVSKAFRLCELKGLLSATVGSGTFVAYDAVTNGRLIGEDGDAVIDMGATVPEPSGNAVLMTLLREMMNGDRAERLFSYPASGAAEWQRDAAAALMARCGCTTDYAAILQALGGQNALTAVLAALFRRGDKLAVDDHTYPGIKTAAAMFGVQLVPVTGDALGMSPEALELICQREKVRGVYLVSASHNPTTVTMPDCRRRAIAQVIRKYGCLLLEDGTYQLMHSGMTSICDDVPEQGIYLVTMSKVIAPGLRTAYLSVPEAYRQAVSDALYSMNIAVVPMMAELSARVIASGRFEEILESHRVETQKRSAVVERYFTPQTCRGQDTDIFRWLHLPPHVSGEAFAREAACRGVRVYPAEKFAVGKTVPAHAARLSICAPPALEELDRGMSTLYHLWESYRA